MMKYKMNILVLASLALAIGPAFAAAAQKAAPPANFDPVPPQANILAVMGEEDTLQQRMVQPDNNSPGGQLEGLLPRGESGEVEAQLLLGDAFYFGKETRQDMEQAFFWYDKAARQGNPMAQRALGAMYKLGKGTSRQPEKAAYWYQKAADQGYAMAQTNLGILYETGEGVAQNFDTARMWYEKAAEQGDARGMTYLGRLYEFGTGVAVDYAKAFSWYMNAAEQGYARAQVNLGALYEAGQGVARDYGQAAAWYSKAAEEGYARGQFYIGRMFENGLGVTADNVAAAEWYSKAAAQDYLPAREQLARLKADSGKRVALPGDSQQKNAANLQDQPVTAAQPERERSDIRPVSASQAQQDGTKDNEKQLGEFDNAGFKVYSPVGHSDNINIPGWQPVSRNNMATLEKSAEFDGIIEPFVIIDVGTPVEGVVQNVMVERSNIVTTGQLLVKLESSVENALVNKARSRANNYAEIELQKEKLAFAERAYDRINDLYTKEAVSNQQKDEAYTEMTTAKQRLQKAEEDQQLAELELKQAEALLAQRYVKSPISGIVVERYIAQGEFVDNQPLLRIAQIDPLRVEVIVPSHMFGKIKPGMKAKVIPELEVYNDLNATVTIVDRVIDAASSSFAVRLEMPNPDYIIPSGLKCSVQFLPEPVPSLAAVGFDKQIPAHSDFMDTPVPIIVPAKTKMIKKMW